MNQEELYQLIDNIPVSPENTEIIEEIKQDLARKRLYSSFTKDKNIRNQKRK